MTIIGGSNGAGISGNMRSGFSFSFLPCRCHIMPADLIADYNAGAELDALFVVRIKNTSGAWVEIDEVNYVQINKAPDTEGETTSITIADSETWSAYGTTHPDLLKPSLRLIQVLFGRDSSDLAPIFTGRITSYQQPEGTAGGSINLTCRDIRSVLQRQSAVAFTDEQTSWHGAKKQLHATLREAGTMFAGQFLDSSGTLTLAGSKLDGVNTAVANRLWYNTSAGAVILATHQYTGVAASGSLISLNDSNIYSASRMFADDSAFNTVLIQGTSGGELTDDIVTDATDAAERGTIYYSGGIVGTQASTIEESTALAEAMIASSLAGKFNAEVPFNPWLEPGQIVQIQSDRFNIPASLAIITRVRHQYQVGAAATYLDQLEILEQCNG